ncbi:39S ribosomal protein L34, mitochondrial [Blastocladiella emersonii ATCC 22665]|nr:39S ribosomal protein L34, mitochondrial [Blastocladiella emersonii ATCC 22665]
MSFLLSAVRGAAISRSPFAALRATAAATTPTPLLSSVTPLASPALNPAGSLLGRWGVNGAGAGAGAMPVQARFMGKFGTEYQPSIIRRKRKWGFLARIKSRLGRNIVARRILKGRKYVSH